ncbi:hypothetical protein C9F11_37470 [Streptomyces sp. YIM 121038]|uniref:hypothetical protein n=1 Tax=Streptomyces sp. YIM 121038 TaxID=2136401 RepID=UPI0011101A53|nr:hypothetical protein [Streptomyces sp. YIM 121038]QCX81077.1 hypothetical protein C9F11_37470 [Streptomyces sp. YIM 121038]
MPNRTDQPPDQPSPALPEPSYAVDVLTTAADVLEGMGRDRRVTETTLRRAVTVAVATHLHTLPTAVADTAAARAWAAIPAGVDGNTHHVQAQVLRGVARRLR